MVWKKEFGADMGLCAIQTDPLDAQRLCLCGDKGTLIVMRLVDLARDRSEPNSQWPLFISLLWSFTCEICY